MSYYHLCPLCDASCDCDKKVCDHCDRDAMADDMTIEQMKEEENGYLDRQNARDVNKRIS